MITDREKDLLIEMDTISDYRLSLFTDEEIIDRMRIFLGFENFRDSQRAVILLKQLDDTKLKELGHIYNIPSKLKFSEALELMDRGLDISTYDFTRKYAYELLTNKENIIKYKHLIEFETIVRHKLWFVCKNKEALNNLTEIYYEEIKEVSTRTILDSVGVKIGDECENWDLGLLIDRLTSLNNREFKDDEIIKVLLDAVTGLKYTNPDFYNDIFKYFDDDYIINNIEYFNPIQLECADRLTETILQAVINNSKVWKRYEFGLSDIKTNLSIDFLFYNCEKINNRMILWKQKNIVKAYKQHCNASIFTDRIDLLRVYLYNARLDEDDLAFLKANIKKSDITEIITHYAKTDDCMSELALHRLVELEGFKNGEN